MSEEQVKSVTEPDSTEKSEADKNEKRGGRNLALLGLAAVVVAVVASAISLSIYHATGDIYLDRSRPGFISEGEEDNDSKDRDKTYVFSQEGAINEDVLDEYLKELEKVEKEIVDASDAFSGDALSDEALGIKE